MNKNLYQRLRDLSAEYAIALADGDVERQEELDAMIGETEREIEEFEEAEYHENKNRQFT